ncbi:MAG: X-Pro dipeptidyl-peptidase [Chloracidobacterium sp. CP2_5A]|nr:MAG: X-Pro dipeptidyl-peptidase [Chloracidobacterium sp. CP2_5A]
MMAYPTSRRRTPWLVIICFALAGGSAFGLAAAWSQGATAARQAGASASDAFDVAARYVKTEARIPMRDGVKLFTSIYAPRDTSRAYPIMLNRTPYSCAPYGEGYRQRIGPSDEMMRDGYIFVFQDARGRYMSEGEFVNLRPHNPNKRGQDIDESSDTYDTIEWLLKNIPNHNGRVGMWGISYPGFYAAAGMIDAHPALKAVSPQAPIADWFIGDDMHHNGAFFLIDSFTFFSSFGQARPEPTTKSPPGFRFPTPDAYQFFLDVGSLRNIEERYFKGGVQFWTEMAAHPNYDAFWQSRNLVPHMNRVAPAVLFVGGWFDAEDLYGPLKLYASVEQRNPNVRNALVMGPWSHGGWARSDGRHLGPIDFGQPTAEFYRREIEAKFFARHLKDAPDPELPEAYIFQTGSNEWRRYAQYPPAGLKPAKLYFHANGRLSLEPPASPSGADEYTSDPRTPVPYTNQITNRRGITYMIEDQRFAAARPDVLTYVTEPLTAPVTLTGPLEAELFVTTTGTDADFVVKLIDVFPDDTPDPEGLPPSIHLGGYQMLVRAEVMRAKFRKGFERPVPLRPGQIERIAFALQDVDHCFKPGHRIMAQVQSSWFPLVDRNPQAFLENIFQARESDFQRATHRIHRSARHASGVRVNLAP